MRKANALKHFVCNLEKNEFEDLPKACVWPLLVLCQGQAMLNQIALKGPLSSIGKSTSFTPRRLLVCIQQGDPLSFALLTIERCQGWVPSTSLELVLLEVTLDNLFEKRIRLVCDQLDKGS